MSRTQNNVVLSPSGILLPKRRNSAILAYHNKSQGHSSNGHRLELEIPMSVVVPQKNGGIRIEGNPIPKARARQTFRNGSVRSYNTPRTQAAEDFLRAKFSEYREQCQDWVKVGIAGKRHGHEYKQYIPLKLTLWCYFIRNDWIPESITIPTMRKLGDADNHLKTILDSMMGILIAEDCQISDARVIKRWSDKGYGYIKLVLEEDAVIV